MESVASGRKICKICGEAKELKDFSGNRATKDGRDIYCKACLSAKSAEWRRNNSVRKNARNKIWYANNKEKRSDYYLRKRYGLNDDDICQLKKVKSCPICGEHVIHSHVGKGTKINRIVVDHDHKTGNVRGFICSRCNGILGQMRDDVSIFRNFVFYLEVAEVFGILQETTNTLNRMVADWWSQLAKAHQDAQVISAECQCSYHSHLRAEGFS